MRSRLAKGLVIFLPLAALAALVAVRAHSRAAPSPERPSAAWPAAAGTQRERTGFHLGVFERNLPGPWAPVAEFTTVAGVRPDLVLYYSDWGEPFRCGFAKQAYAHGAAVIIQIQPWDTALTAIAQGAYDGYIRSFAGEVRRFGHPVVIGFGHEMNGVWYPWGWKRQSAASFIAAWRHIVDVFKHEGDTNVTWLWTISSSVGKRSAPLSAYWPGRRYVTWVGLDGYYYKRRWAFGRVFGRQIRQIRQITSKPVLLAEVGIGQVAGQARMIPNLFVGIRQYHLLGLVWFDVAQHQGLYHQDWRLEGHQAAVTAFQRAMTRMLHQSPR